MSQRDTQRAFVSNMYDSPGWKQRVRKMGDTQIYAIYMREQKRREEPKPVKKPKPDSPF